MENRPKPEGLSRHTLLMIVGCGVPLALIAAVSLFRIDLGGVGYWAILLLCPLVHLFMMRGKHGHGREKSCHAEGENVQVASMPQRDERAKVPASLER